MFNKSVWALIGCFLINSVVELFVNIFLTAHMLSLSDNNIAIISQFFIVAYVTLGIGFTVFLPLAKKIKKTILIQIGAVVKTVFLLLVVLLNKTLLQHYVWLAIMYGLIETIFWSGANTAKNKVVESNKIKSLMSVVNINSKVVGIVCPVLFGLSIDAWSFQKIAIVI